MFQRVARLNFDNVEKQFLPWVIFFSLIFLFSTPLFATDFEVSYDGAASGNWNNASNWDPDGVPNNGGGDTYDVTIDTNSGQVSVVTLDTTVTVSELTIETNSGSLAADSLVISNGRIINIVNTGTNDGTITNNGSIDLGGLSLLTAINILSGDATLTGGGVTKLSHASQDRITATNTTSTLVNDTNQTIEGYGHVGANTIGTLNNKGTIKSNVSGQTLIVDILNSLTNSGAVVAENGGDMNIVGGTLTTSGAGHFTAKDDSVMSFNTVDMEGTYVAEDSTSVVLITGSSAAGGAIFGGLGALQASNNVMLNVEDGEKITFNLTFDPLGTSLNTGLYFEGNGTVDGSGGITLNEAQDVITGANGANVEFQLPVTGFGHVGLNTFNIVNKGLIHSNVDNQTLTIDAKDTITTQAEFRASSGGLMNVLGGTITTTGTGNFTAKDDSVISFNTVDLEGSYVAEDAASVLLFTGSSTLGGATFSGLGTVRANNNVTLTVEDGEKVTFNLTFDPLGTSLNTGLFFAGNGTVDGSSGITLNEAQDVINGTNGANVELQLPVTGFGKIGLNNLNINNKTLIHSNVLNQTLTVDPKDTITSQGEFRASNGGDIHFVGGTLASTGTGNFTAKDSSTIFFTGVDLTGSYVAEDAASTLNFITTSTVSGSTFSGSGNVTSNNNVFLRIEDGDQWILNASYSPLGTSLNSGLYFEGSGTVDGTGDITLNEAQDVIDGVDGFEVGIRVPITGFGQIGLNRGNIINEDVIHSNVANQNLNIDVKETLTNKNTIKASGGGRLNFLAGTITNTGTGQTIIQGNSTAFFNVGVSYSGKLDLQDTGSVAHFIGTSDVGGMTVTGNGSIISNNNVFLDVGDGETFSVGAKWEVGGTSLNSGLRVTGNATMDGSGEMILNEAQDGIFGSGTNARLTLGANYTVSGFGRLGIGNMKFLNQGLVRLSGGNTIITPADDAAGLAGTGFRNTSTGTLELSGSSASVTFTDNANKTRENDGTLKASDGADWNINVSWSGSGRLNANGGKLSIANGVSVHTPSTAGDVTITNSGTNIGEVEVVSGGSLYANDISVGLDSRLTIGGFVQTRGSYTFSSTDETDIDFASGSEVVVTGGPNVTWEVGGRDLGGFTNNFSLDQLVVNGTVKLVDAFDNQPGDDEALYVDTLQLGANAVVLKNGLNLYWNTLVGNASQIIEGNTPTGEDIEVSLGDGVTLNFGETTGSGSTTKTASTQQKIDDVLADDKAAEVLSDTFFDITVDFTFDTDKGFTVGIPYDQGDFDTQLGARFDETELRLFHRTGSGGIEDITTSVDTVNNIVFGKAFSFSDFGVGVNPEPATLILLGSGLLGLIPFRRRFR